jgi:hypothetical protein
MFVENLRGRDEGSFERFVAKVLKGAPFGRAFGEHFGEDLDGV